MNPGTVKSVPIFWRVLSVPDLHVMPKLIAHSVITFPFAALSAVCAAGTFVIIFGDLL